MLCVHSEPVVLDLARARGGRDTPYHIRLVQRLPAARWEVEDLKAGYPAE